MTKLQLGAVSALLVACAVTGVVEGRANYQLKTEIAALETQRPPSLPARERVAAESTTIAGSSLSADMRALERAEHRLAILKARPRGVIDEEIKPLENSGRATPEAALRTLIWAMCNRNLDTLAQFLSIRDDSPESRAQFLAQLSEPVREKYRTPERFIADALAHDEIEVQAADPIVAMQVFETKWEHSDSARLSYWARLASGKEELHDSRAVERIGNGWAGGLIDSLANVNFQKWIFARIDPQSGAYLKPQPKSR